ncbi:Proline dehydrogenase [Paragonimus skrjabini miyazakii]|uniref:Proline dehydrogenase n=1 Tax=Paragonimus skrjabini miyazakii TaxID=59628 RepID=A0A8S9YJS4_9TREM|nr:Proline dehydrogenase [Paragonimus skrjabini miyazakii]
MQGFVVGRVRSICGILSITPVLSVAANFSSVAPTNTKSSQTFRKESGFSDLNFRDPTVAHVAKTNTELLRGLLVYKMCTLPFLVKKNKELMNISRRLLGKRLFRFLMKSTFYGHFVGGEHPDSIKPVIKRIRKYGVKSILDYSVEEDIQESEAVEKVKDSLATVVHEPDVRPAAATKEFQTSLRFADRSKKVVGARTYFYESEYQCDKNMETFLHCIDNVSNSTEKEGFAAIKVTALGRPQLLLQMSDFLIQMERLFHLLVKGSVKSDEKSTHSSTFLDVDSFREQLTRLGIQISFDENVKWFTLLDVSGDGVVDLLDWSHLRAFEYDLSQLFTVKNKKTGKMEQLVPTLTADGLEQMRNMLQRVDTIARVSSNYISYNHYGGSCS